MCSCPKETPVFYFCALIKIFSPCHHLTGKSGLKCPVFSEGGTDVFVGFGIVGDAHVLDIIDELAILVAYGQCAGAKVNPSAPFEG